MIDEQAAQLIEQNKMLLQKVAVLEEELQLQKDLVAALLKRFYGAGVPPFFEPTLMRVE